MSPAQAVERRRAAAHAIRAQARAAERMSRSATIAFPEDWAREARALRLHAARLEREAAELLADAEAEL